MKTLITGPGGFAGRYLVDEIRAKQGPSNRIIGAGIEDIAPDKRGKLDEYTQLDIFDNLAVRKYLQSNRPDVIFHLAAVSSVGVSIKNPLDTFRANVMGSLHILESCLKDLGGKVIILLVGSADIYMSDDSGKAMNEQTLHMPLNPYAVSKAAVDNLGRMYWKNFGLKVIRTRSFNHIGPGQSPNFVVSDFARQIARIEKGIQAPEIHVGNLQAKRDFTDVRDVVKAYRMILEEGLEGEVYNVCSNKAISIRDLLDIMLNLSVAEIEIKNDPAKMRPSDNPILLGDNTKLRAHTGWQPSIPIEETLLDVLDFWRERVSIESA